jgi:hypothetical protein
MLAPPLVGDAYNNRSAVRIAGYGELSAAEAGILTTEEREKLRRR